jgi:DNA polymerase IV
VRLIPFITKTRGAALLAPSSAPGDIVAGARAALERFPPIERPVRLLGVRAEFAEDDPGNGGLGQPMLNSPGPDADEG